ncbi:hypothetical protein R6Q59_034333 [Mikania micrantha]
MDQNKFDPLEWRFILWPEDILVFGWEGGKHSCVDLTGVSPFVGLRDTGFVAGQSALKAESGKDAKHEKACLENQHVFIPFAFDTFGFLVPEAVNFLNRVQRVMDSNITAPRTQKIVFSRIEFAIQKGIAVKLVARLPKIEVVMMNRKLADDNELLNGFHGSIFYMRIWPYGTRTRNLLYVDMGLEPDGICLAQEIWPANQTYIINGFYIRVSRSGYVGFTVTHCEVHNNRNEFLNEPYAL